MAADEASEVRRQPEKPGDERVARRERGTAVEKAVIGAGRRTFKSG
jgi:hypothetical protein